MKVINYNVLCFPLLTASEETHAVVDVLTQDKQGLWAVYRAITDTYDHEAMDGWMADRIAHRGAKLRFRDARTSFPTIKEEDYRA